MLRLACGASIALILSFATIAAAQESPRSPPTAKVVNIRSFTNSLNAEVDVSSALNRCLNAAGKGGTCLADGATLAIAESDITIPANTTLSCGDAFPVSDVVIADFSNLPSLRIDAARKIKAGGQGATLKNCLLYRGGMTFPVTDQGASFRGTGISADGHADLTIKDTVILGFDTCVDYPSGSGRPQMYHVWLDCKGTAQAALVLDTGNTDSGYVTDIKIQPFASGVAKGSAPACNRARPGNGIRVAGPGGNGIFMDRVVVFEMRGIGYDFQVSAQVGTIDYDSFQPKCGYTGGNVGVRIGRGALVNGATVYINAANTPLEALGGGAVSHISSLSIFFANQNAIELGNASVSGSLAGDTLVMDEVTGFAVNVGHANGYFKFNRIMAHSLRMVREHSGGSEIHYSFVPGRRSRTAARARSA